MKMGTLLSISLLSDCYSIHCDCFVMTRVASSVYIFCYYISAYANDEVHVSVYFLDLHFMNLFEAKDHIVTC